jgi:hypothetical protein
MVKGKGEGGNHRVVCPTIGHYVEWPAARMRLGIEGMNYSGIPIELPYCPFQLKDDSSSSWPQTVKPWRYLALEPADVAAWMDYHVYVDE